MYIYIYLKICTVYIYDHFDSFLPVKKSINEIIINQRSSFIIRVIGRTRKYYLFYTKYNNTHTFLLRKIINNTQQVLFYTII